MHPTDPPSPTLPIRRLARSAAAIAAPAVIWCGTFWLLARSASPDVPPGRCEGIGFGCELSPRGAVELSGFLFGVFVVPIATVVTAVCLAAREHRRRRRG